MKNIIATGKNLDGGGKNRVSGGKKGLAILPPSAKPLAVIGKNDGSKMDDTGKNPPAPSVVIKSKRGFKRYESNPSVPSPGGLPTHTKRVQVPGGKASVIIDNSSGEIRGIGGMGICIRPANPILRGMIRSSVNVPNQILIGFIAKLRL